MSKFVSIFLFIGNIFCAYIDLLNVSVWDSIRVLIKCKLSCWLKQAFKQKGKYDIVSATYFQCVNSLCKTCMLASGYAFVYSYLWLFVFVCMLACVYDKTRILFNSGWASVCFPLHIVHIVSMSRCCSPKLSLENFLSLNSTQILYLVFRRVTAFA